MTIETRVRPYEVLIRHNPDGTFAAHQRDLIEHVDTKTGIPVPGFPSVEGEPMPIDPKRIPGVLSDMLPAAVARAKGAEAGRDADAHRIAELTALVAQLQATINSFGARVVETHSAVSEHAKGMVEEAALAVARAMPAPPQ